MTAAITFMLAMIFSPGPNNIMSASLGLMYGYPRALRFILGVASGFTIVAILGAVVAGALLSVVPTVQPFLKYVGAAYIMWLAWVTWSHRSAFGAADDEVQPTRSQGYLGGFALQFANPKGMTFALVMYSTFLAEWTGDILFTLASAAVFGAVAFAATSTWALAGSAIRKWLKTDRQRAVAAALMAAALIYTAIELAELPSLLLG